MRSYDSSTKTLWVTNSVMGTRLKRLPAKKCMELVDAAREGDKEAMDELCRLNEPLIRGIASRYCKKHKDLQQDDVLQECWIHFFNAVKTFKPMSERSGVTPWASLCVRNGISDMWLKNRLIRLPSELKERFSEQIETALRVKNAGSVVIGGEEIPHAEIFADQKTIDPSEKAASRERMRIIKKHVYSAKRVLTKKQKSDIDRYFRGETPSEIVKNDGRSRQAANFNIRTGLRKMAKSIGRKSEFLSKVLG